MHQGKLVHEWAVWAVAIFVVVAIYVLPPRIAYRPIAPDFVEAYHPGALSIKAGNGYRAPGGQVITHWPPGYSLFLVPWVSEDTASTVRTLRLVTSALGILWVFLLARLSLRLEPAAPLWITLPLAVGPSMLVLSSPVVGELLFATLATAAVSLMVIVLEPPVAGKPSSQPLLLSFLAGFVLGYAALVKTIGLPLLLAAVIVFAALAPAIAARRFALCLALLLGAAVPITPWMWYFHSATGRVGFTTAGSSSMRDGLQRFPEYDSGRSLREESRRWRSTSDALGAVGTAFRENPGSTLAMLTEKLGRVWYATDSGRFDGVFKFVQLPWLAVFISCCVRLIAGLRSARPLFALLALMVLGVWASGFLALSIFRYLSTVFAFVPLLGIAIHWRWLHPWMTRFLVASRRLS